MGYSFHQPTYFMQHNGHEPMNPEQKWICIRGFSHAAAWIERYKSVQNKNLQKAKALRILRWRSVYIAIVCLNVYALARIARVNYLASNPSIYGTVSAKIAPRSKCYKNASRLNRCNFPTDNAIDFLFSILQVKWCSMKC